MPRPPKPYLERGWYISRAGGEYIRLCIESDGLEKAGDLLEEHLDRRRREAEANGGRLPQRLTVAELLALFLEAVEAEKPEDTFLYCQRWCVEFAKLHGSRYAADLRRFDAQQFKQHMLRTSVVG